MELRAADASAWSSVDVAKMKLNPPDSLRKDDPELWILEQHDLEIPEHGRTLDVGGTDNDLSYVLQQRGVEAWAVDLRPYGLPLEYFIQGNFHTAQIPENYFDCAFDISAVHHFGVEHYLPVETRDDDIRAAEKIWRCLKPTGVFYSCMDRFATEYKETDFFHQYSAEAYKERFHMFHFEQEEYYDVFCRQVPYADQWMAIGFFKMRKT
jgi:SAM-dependent methyltransferase